MANFLIFTYMFKPIAKPETADLFGEKVVDIQESLARKQELLGEMFPKQTAQGTFPKPASTVNCDKGEEGDGLRFIDKEMEYLHKMMVNEMDIIAFKIANNKKIMHHTAAFTDEEFEDHPNCMVIIDNRKDRQVIAIEQKPRAFSSASVVAKILAETFNKGLAQYRLSLTIDAKYHKNGFWHVVNRYQKGIKSMTFVFPYPNLPAITEMVGETMKQVALEMNCEPTQILKALDSQILNIDKDSRMLLDMIDACAASGKPILILPVGRRRVIKCNSSKSLVTEDLSDEVIGNLMNKDFFNTCFGSLVEFVNHIKLVYE
jgi:hypothetical protein